MFIERNGYAMSAQPITGEWMERMRGKPDFVERLFTVFVTEEPKRLERIREALGREDAEAMAYLTHSLKGSAATMGAEELRECCLKLELAAKDGDLAASRAAFGELEAAMERVYGFMRAVLGSSGSNN